MSQNENQVNHITPEKLEQIQDLLIKDEEKTEQQRRDEKHGLYGSKIDAAN